VAAQPRLALGEEHRVLGIDVVPQAGGVLEREPLERRERVGVVALEPDDGRQRVQERAETVVIAGEDGDRTTVGRELGIVFQGKEERVLLPRMVEPSRVEAEEPQQA
jgi:hypothetical protein